MGISKTEINLMRLIAAAPRQKNQTKLAHYVAKLRELLEELGAETTPEGLSSVSIAKLREYSEKIEALGAQLAAPMVQELEAVETPKESPPKETGLRQRITHDQAVIVDTGNETSGGKRMAPARLDDAAHTHIEKHRRIQEDLTDDMVSLARRLKENSLLMNQSLQETEKVLDSTEKAVEHSLAGTNRANTRATAIYSQSTKTSCLTWLVIIFMISVFIMVVLLIRIT